MGTPIDIWKQSIWQKGIRDYLLTDAALNLIALYGGEVGHMSTTVSFNGSETPYFFLYTTESLRGLKSRLEARHA